MNSNLRPTPGSIPLLLLLPLLALLSACAPGTMIEKLADDGKEKIARDYIQRLIDGDTTGLVAELDPSLQAGNAVAEFTKMAAVLPKEAPTVTNLVGYHFNFSTNQPRQYNLTYQFGYGSKWVLTNVAWRELPDGKRLIVGMRVHQLPQALQETHALSLKRAGPWHYFFLAAAIGVAVFILVTLVTCIRTKLPRRKWLWIVFILLGFVRFSINWTTGEMTFAPITVLLFGASALTQSVYSPWTISFALPVGAALFWIKRRRLLRPPPPLPTGDTANPPGGGEANPPLSTAPLPNSCSLAASIASAPLQSPFKTLPIAHDSPHSSSRMFDRLFLRHLSLAPSQRWMLAAGGTLTKMHGDKFDRLSFHYGAKISQRVLADWWDTHDHAGLLKTLKWLNDGGHRAEALERATEMKELLAHTTDGTEVELGEMGVFLANNRHIIERVGLDAWDYSRLINVARWGFTAGYLSEADTWTWGLGAARKLQSRYRSWRDLGDSIVIGLRYWSVGKLPMPDFSACHEQMISDPKSPWNQIPWDTPLTG